MFFFYIWYNFVIIFVILFLGIWYIILLVVFFNSKECNIWGIFYFIDGFINSLVILVYICKGKYKICLIFVLLLDVVFEIFLVFWWIV